MAKYKVSGSDLTNVADAIRTKGGTSASLSFPDGFVSAVAAIPTGGGSTLITKNITVNGTYDAQNDDADGYSSVTVNVPSTSGGSVITGTFTGADAEKGTAKTIIVPYSGSGYPISVLIYPTAGAYKSETDIYTSTRNKAVVTFMVIKSDVSLVPDYNGNELKNHAYGITTYKGSSSDAGVYSSNNVVKNTITYYRYTADGSSAISVVRFYNSGTNLTVFIASDNVSDYGFLAGTEYTYVIQYSA